MKATGPKRFEEEANWFAIALLMPSGSFASSFERLGITPPVNAVDDEPIRRLANLYQVSVPMMTERLRDLGHLSCGLQGDSYTNGRKDR